MTQKETRYEHELRCMSYNIKNAYEMEGEHGWLSRRQMVAGTIRFHRPDLVGMQEVLHNQLEDLERELPEYGWVGVGREDGDKEGEYACIFYRKKRFEVLESDSFWLSEQPEAVASMGWDAACTRIVTWVKLHDVLNDRILYHYNTHFDHVGVMAVEQSAYLIQKRIAEMTAGSDVPVLLTGDFNVTADSVPYRVLCQPLETDVGVCSLQDASTVAEYKHFGPAFTYQGFDSRELAARMFPNYIPSQEKHEIEFEAPIDFIFNNEQVRVLSYGMVSDHDKGKVPSDHFPIVVDVQFR